MKQLISNAARQAERSRYPKLFYRSAREGFLDFLNATLEPDGNRLVMLPAFIGWSPREGSGVFDPVQQSRAEVAFYSLRSDLTVDIDMLSAALAEFSCKVLVVIHYFGRPESEIAAIRAMADAAGAILVEDLAHGFYSSTVGGVIGRYGALNLFSLHKMFPFEDGGMIEYRDPALLSTQNETAPELARVLMDFDWVEIAQARRRNFMALTERIREIPECGSAFELLWPALAIDAVPQTLPIRILDGGRDYIYKTMNADGFGMTSLYHTLIDDLQIGFPSMVDLSQAITNFPVHQDLDPALIDAMIQSFRGALAGRPRVIQET